MLEYASGSILTALRQENTADADLSVVEQLKEPGEVDEAGGVDGVAGAGAGAGAVGVVVVGAKGVVVKVGQLQKEGVGKTSSSAAGS